MKYDFNKVDFEEASPDGMFFVPIWHSLIFPVIALGTLQVGAVIFLENPFSAFITIPGAILLMVVYFYIKNIGDCPWGKVALNLQNARDGFKLFFWEKLKSFLAVHGAAALTFFNTRRTYITLAHSMKIFAVIFVPLFCANVLFNVVSEFNHYASIFPESIAGFLTVDGLIAGVVKVSNNLFIRFVIVIAGLIVFFVGHVFILILFSLVSTWLILAITIPFRTRLSDGQQGLFSGFVHLSDLHITAPGKMAIEGNGVTTEKVFKRLKAACRGNSILVLSGDITDSGGRLEWRELLAKLSRRKDVRIILAPGNHDLFPYSPKRLHWFRSLKLGSSLPRIRKLRYLSAVLKLCPNMTILINNKLQDLNSYISTTAVDSIDNNCTDSELACVDDVWNNCFPMYCIIENKAFVCLDTNRDSSNFFTSAFGEISDEQLGRLEQILDILGRNGIDKIAVVGHHHVYTPTGGFGKNYNAKYLELFDGDLYLKRIASRADYYLHGHRHYPFEFKSERLQVRSAPSVRYS